MSIRTLYDLSAVYLRTLKLDKDTSFIAGAELEIEDVETYEEAFMDQNAIRVEEDGSLRNDGREFLLPPSHKDRLCYLFSEIHHNLSLGQDPYTNRTSTHIHVNCMYSTEMQVRNLLWLYAIFEPLAFHYVGPQRKNNIHCVPLNYTTMPSVYGQDLVTIVDRWHKYTAFNLIPLRELGTVEFRHLEGTGDTRRFRVWLEFIETLWTAAHSRDILTVADLLDLTWLRELQGKLLTPEFVANCREWPQYRLEDNLFDVKLVYV